ncbi:hypothetical protein PSHT_08717, partial [Puccinia striiformis]
SDFAFALFLPHDKVKGTLADPTTGYNVTGGPSVVPDYRIEIDFTKQKGAVKLLWASKNLKSTTLHPSSHRQQSLHLSSYVFTD